MFDLNGVLAGFVVGVFSGIFIAYKLAQRGRSNERPPIQYPDKKSVKAEIVSDQISFLNGQQVRK